MPFRFDKLTTKAQALVAEAQAQATSKGNAEISPLHLVTGVADVGLGGLVADLVFCGVDFMTGGTGDIFGGVVAAVIAVPLALAFGVASGAGAGAGLYGAIFVGFFAA